MKIRALASIVFPLLVGSCAPAACEPTPPPTEATGPPPVYQPYGWTLCVDSDGGTVTERMPGNVLVTYSFPAATVPQASIDAAVADVRKRYAEWGISVVHGPCPQDNRSFTIYLTPDRAPEQRILAGGWAGYAYTNGWGLLDPSGYNHGFVFTDYVGADRLGVYIAHEAGHGAGLDHPYNPERNIMFDLDPTLGWSDAQRSVLAAKFMNPPAGMVVEPERHLTPVN